MTPFSQVMMSPPNPGRFMNRSLLALSILATLAISGCTVAESEANRDWVGSVRGELHAMGLHL